MLKSTRPVKPRATPPVPPALPPPIPFPDPIPGVIKFGTVTLLSGEARIGKSPLLLEWCARWRDGRPIFGRPTNPPTALYYIATDRGWEDSYQHWCDLVGFPDLPHYAIADDLTIDLQTFANEKTACTAFAKCLDKANPIPGAHVFVDAVSPLFVPGDPNRARPVMIAIQRYRRECRTRQINLTVTAHHAKQLNDTSKQYKRLIDRTAGAGAFAGYSDCQLTLVGPSEEEPWYTFEWNPPHEPATQFKLERLPNGLFAPFTGFTPADRVLAEVKPQALPLLDLIPSDTLIRFGELVEKAQLNALGSEATIKRLLENLEAADLIERPHGYIKRRKVN